MKLFTCVLLAYLALMTTVQAASFDCTKASTKIEKMICRDAELSKFDDDLALAYQHTLDQSDDKQKVIIEQRLWLKNIRNACKDESCLKQSYQSRISQEGNTFTEKCTTTPKLAFGNAHALVLT